MEDRNKRREAAETAARQHARIGVQQQARQQARRQQGGASGYKPLQVLSGEEDNGDRSDESNDNKYNNK